MQSVIEFRNVIVNITSAYYKSLTFSEPSNIAALTINEYCI